MSKYCRHCGELLSVVEAQLDESVRSRVIGMFAMSLQAAL